MDRRDFLKIAGFGLIPFLTPPSIFIPEIKDVSPSLIPNDFDAFISSMKNEMPRIFLVSGSTMLNLHPVAERISQNLGRCQTLHVAEPFGNSFDRGHQQKKLCRCIMELNREISKENHHVVLAAESGWGTPPMFFSGVVFSLRRKYKEIWTVKNRFSGERPTFSWPSGNSLRKDFPGTIIKNIFDGETIS